MSLAAAVQLDMDYNVRIGRGRHIKENDGNVRFVQIIRDNLDVYMKATTKNQKSEVILSILQQVRSEHGADFVKFNASTARYEKVEEAAARITIAQTLRDSLAQHYKSSKGHKQQRRAQQQQLKANKKQQESQLQDQLLKRLMQQQQQLQLKQQQQQQQQQMAWKLQLQKQQSQPTLMNLPLPLPNMARSLSVGCQAMPTPHLSRNVSMPLPLARNTSMTLANQELAQALEPTPLPSPKVTAPPAPGYFASSLQPLRPTPRMVSLDSDDDDSHKNQVTQNLRGILTNAVQDTDLPFVVAAAAAAAAPTPAPVSSLELSFSSLPSTVNVPINNNTIANNNLVDDDEEEDHHDEETVLDDVFSSLYKAFGPNNNNGPKKTASPTNKKQSPFEPTPIMLDTTGIIPDDIPSDDNDSVTSFLNGSVSSLNLHLEENGAFDWEQPLVAL